MRPNWDEYFMLRAKLVATRSTCNSRPTGCVIVKDDHVVASGYNGAVAGAPHCLGRTVEIEGRVVPYCRRRARGVNNFHKQFTCAANHAEINALAQAAKMGISVDGGAIYLTLNPCLICLKALFAAGIREIYYEHLYDLNPDNWHEETLRMGFKAVVPIKIRREVMANVINLLTGITSERRLPATD